jgi:hypothetical protein
VSNLKFQRYYRITIQGLTRLWTVSYPFTLRMEITRSTLASANTGRFTLYNLPPDMRRDIFMDRTTSLTYRQCSLSAGYAGVIAFKAGAPPPAVFSGSLPIGTTPPGANLYATFKGNVMSCCSERRGADWVTTIEAFDGGLAMYSPKSTASVTLAAPWTGLQALEALVGSMQNVSLGAVSQGVNIPGDKNKGHSFHGDAWTLVQDLVKTSRIMVGDQEITAYAYIDNEKVNVAMENDVPIKQTLILEGAVPPGPGTGSQFTWPTLNAGIIGVPKRQAGIVEVTMLFAPSVRVGQQAQLRVFSFTRGGGSQPSEWNGTYQVRGIRHEGTISAAFDGGCRTIVQLWDSSKALATAGLIPQVAA